MSAILKMITAIGEAKVKLASARRFAEEIRMAVSSGEMSCAKSLFEMAEQVSDSASVSEYREDVERAGFVNLLDLRSLEWTGDTECVKYMMQNQKLSVLGKPDLWFWSDDMVACFYRNTYSWVIFSHENIVEFKDDDEEKNRNLH